MDADVTHCCHAHCAKLLNGLRKEGGGSEGEPSR